MLRTSAKPSNPPKPLNKPTRGRVYPPPTPSQTVRLAQSQTFPGVTVAPLTFKILGNNEYHLLMGTFGSDQSRHVDDFGVKKRNVDDFVARKSSFRRHLAPQPNPKPTPIQPQPNPNPNQHNPIQPNPTQPNLFIDDRASIYRCGHLFLDASIYL